MIPVNEPLVLQKDIKYVTDALKTGWISSEGKYIKLFEEKFAEYLGVRHAITVNNGTNALILAMRSLNFPRGSEVILPTHTIISCALAIVYNDLVPVFIDSELDTWCIDTKQIESKITEKTKAIMPVHIYGHSTNLNDIFKIAKKYNLIVIEDFAEAIGSKYKGQKCGSFGEVNCASLYANKTITTGEGGLCVTNNDELNEKLRRLKNLSFVSERRFVHYELGYNYRMTNVQAAIGLAQTERIEEHVKKKIWIGKLYNELLKDLRDENIIQLPCEKKWAVNTYWVYGVVLNSKLGINAREIMKLLSEKGIMTRPFFFPLHLQPVFKKSFWFKEEKLPVAENISEYGFYLPSGLTLDEAKIFTVTKIFKEIISEIY